ncbi:MAG: hypothetical protein MJ184_03920 [Treponema sp.]|uniref:hypothetical protein n=1 Tax=Treponema sp. TaxID=166 RepID=UPI00298DC79C|nr:hypothetical protein [Treponema sp.]MCQ2600487.1 hypothetical protein [Treponema sp.]
MKKNTITKIFTAAVFTAMVLTGFTGCMDPIFQNIKQEVKLENPTKLGEVYSFARIGDDQIYFANGRIYHKNKTLEGHGGWFEFAKPEGHVLTIASDSADWLYAVCVYYGKNDSDGEMKVTGKKLFACDTTAATPVWKELTNVTLSAGQTCALMGTNSVTKTRREAFINTGAKGYKLSGGTASENSSAAGKKSCASLNGTTEFFPGNAACSNNDDSVVYYSNGSTVSMKGAKTGDLTTNIRSTIHGIAVLNDSVFVTSAAGAALVDIDTKKEIQFSNLQATLSTLYEGRACIVCDPTKNHEQSIIYAGITVKGTGSNSALFTHEGLWSYYPSRGKWNIE